MKVEFESDSKGFSEAREVLAITRYLLSSDAHLNRDLILLLERAALHHLQTPELSEIANKEGIAETLFKGGNISKRLRGFWDSFVSPGVKNEVENQQSSSNPDQQIVPPEAEKNLSSHITQPENSSPDLYLVPQKISLKAEQDALATALALEDKITELQASLDKISGENEKD